MQPGSCIVRAVKFAADKHSAHRRKDAAATPYFNHLAEVAEILVSVAGVDDAEILAAAYLHDTIEDTDTSREELAAEFGPRVAELVEAVSDDKSLPKQRRKELQIEHAAHASAEAGLLKLADKIANLRSLLVNPPPTWGAERVAAYFAWAQRVVDALPAKDAALFAEFSRVQQAFAARR
ncbi:MAG: HD domain-containing protein [Opitutales bacterium]